MRKSVKPPVERWASHVKWTPTCWYWTASKTPKGYGTFSNVLGRQKHMPAHRFAYIVFRGSIPDGLVLDHLCRHRDCVNPWHLEPVTDRENLRRGLPSVADRNRAKTHCIRGHEYTPENTYRYKKRNGKHCKTCVRENQREKHDHYLELRRKRRALQRVA